MTSFSLFHTKRPPTSAPPAGARPPLVVLMHGVGSNERSMDSVASALDPRALVLSVRSPLLFGADAYGWFHVTFTAQGPVIAPDEAAAGWQLIARFIDEAVAAHDADPDRVYVGGFSQGGIMALAALLTAPEKIAGAFCMSGRLLPEALLHGARERLAGKAALIVHGASDGKLDVRFARWARANLTALGVDLDYQEFPMGHQITPDSLDRVSRWLSAQIEAAR